MALPNMRSGITSREFLRIAGGFGAAAVGSSPAGGLDIDNAGNLATDGDVTINGNLDIGGGYGDTGVTVQSNGDVVLDGKIGIGTDTPATQLYLSGVNPVLTLYDERNLTWTVGDELASIDIISADNSSGHADESRAKIAAVQESTFGTNVGLAFYTSDFNVSEERMRIGNSGDVSISGDLTVQGNDIDIGDSGGFSGMKFNPASTRLEFWIDGTIIGHIGTDGAYTDDVV